MAKMTDKYVSHDVQNELLKDMALSVVRDIVAAIGKSTFFSIMCDECTDASNQQQLILCIRWINDGLEPQRGRCDWLVQSEQQLH